MAADWLPAVADAAVEPPAAVGTPGPVGRRVDAAPPNPPVPYFSLFFMALKVVMTVVTANVLSEHHVGSYHLLYKMKQSIISHCFGSSVRVTIILSIWIMPNMDKNI